MAAHGLCDELRPGLPGLDAACGTSCAVPRSLAERGCVSAGLPTAAWREGRRPDTPAGDYPSVRDVCAAGLSSAVDRTVGWLALASDYQLQAAEGNAGVIATQLCLERRYESLTCLGGSAAGATACADDPNWVSIMGAQYSCDTYVEGIRMSNHQYCDQDSDASGRLAADACPAACGRCTAQSATSPAATLADLHGQACALAESVGKGHSVDTLLSTTDVPPLSLSVYHSTFGSVQAYGNLLKQSYNALSVRSDFQTTLSRSAAVSAADAVDEQGLWQTKADAAAERMVVYRTQIQEIDATLQQTLQSMQLDGPALLQSVSGQIDTSRRNFRSAVSAAALRAEERSALEQSVRGIANQQAAIQQQLATLRADRKSVV